MRTPILACLAFLSFSTAPHADERAFGEAWYQENILGDLEGASRAYLRLFDDGESSRELRHRAGYQAGRCLERLGDSGRARKVYRLLLEDLGEDDGVLEERVHGRLRQLEPASPETEDAPAEGELGELTAELSKIVERRRGVLESVTREHEALRERRERRERLRKRLSRRGIEIVPGIFRPGDEPAPENSESPSDLSDITGLPDLSGLDAADRELIEERLLAELRAAALEAIRLDRPREALDLFRVQSRLRREVQVSEWIRDLEDLLERMDGLRSVAGRRLEELTAVRRAETEARLRREVRPPADGASPGGERILAARRLLDWADTDGLGVLPRSLWLGLWRGTGDVRPDPEGWLALERRVEESRQTVDRLIDLLVRGWIRDASRDELARVELVERAHSLSRLGEHVRQVSTFLERSSGPEELRESLEMIFREEIPDPAEPLRQLLQLLEWFPALDSRGSLRALIEANL